MDQIPAIHQTVVEQSNSKWIIMLQLQSFPVWHSIVKVAKQKAKELYQQLKTINMAKHSDPLYG